MIVPDFANFKRKLFGIKSKKKLRVFRRRDILDAVSHLTKSALEKSLDVRFKKAK